MNDGLYRENFRERTQRFRREPNGVAERILSFAQLISAESQRRLEKTVSALRSARHPDELRKAVESVRGALNDLYEEITRHVPEQAGELRSISDATQELARRLLEGEPLSEAEDVYAEIKARNIPKFPKEQRSVPRADRMDPLEFLRLHYGEFLTYFGAPRNRISQLHLGEVDPDLLASIRNRINYLVRKREWSTELREIIPPYGDFLTEQLEAIPRDRLLSSAQLGNVLQARERRTKRKD